MAIWIFRTAVRFKINFGWLIIMSKKWLNNIGITLVLFAFWVAVSGAFNWPQMVVGFAASAFVVYFNRNLVITAEDRPPVNIKNIFWIFGYFFKLLRDIFIANFQVAYIVLHPKMPIVPNLVPLRVEIDSVASRVLLGNSITLCPGTLTVLADEKDFLVHALTIESGEEVKTWHPIARLQQMERDVE